jgi:GxxExxY protein
METITHLTKGYLDKVSYSIIGAAIEVHKALGPGLLESAYHKCLAHELGLRGHSFVSGMLAPFIYKGVRLESHLRCDFFVEACIVVEIKSAEGLMPVHESQLLTYMRLLNAPKGILLNFNCFNLFNGGQKTMVNSLYKNLSK